MNIRDDKMAIEDESNCTRVLNFGPQMLELRVGIAGQDSQPSPRLVTHLYVKYPGIQVLAFFNTPVIETLEASVERNFLPFCTLKSKFGLRIVPIQPGKKRYHRGLPDVEIALSGIKAKSSTHARCRWYIYSEQNTSRAGC